MVQHGHRQLPILLQALADGLRRVVYAVLDLCPVQQPPDQLLLGHLQRKHQLNGPALGLEDRIQHPGLLKRAREPVQQHVAGALLAQPALDDAVDQVVRHQLAPGHLRGLAAQLAVPFRLRSEDVPRGEVGEAELLLDPGRLRPLPAARGPEDESDQSIRRGRR